MTWAVSVIKVLGLAALAVIHLLRDVSGDLSVSCESNIIDKQSAIGFDNQSVHPTSLF